MLTYPTCVATYEDQSDDTENDTETMLDYGSARWLAGSQPAVSGPIERRKERVVQAERKGGNQVGKERLARSMLKRHLPK
ncbi:hypothetical protein NDA11_007973 [Ustilago hordei]|uniref:Uncharacterized protein n=1 Tax=Ustilago hordei TaxID=120017 RepID=I2G0W4_USTHO|nr:uncharacterized protein UHO2_03241 [Ustilago hordei]KAJ1041124.1 hypothetical protein NDA10_002127 [Ustilago hordei]KAJ1580964.1 hypothetical protein NDA15_001616 [Ustilago hordei]KAJ1582793.1 hypothetical protein NDA12_003055 [Ustilago hordei]KAJ1588877.1 hypothetical protein NDA11_007973 [Ustilago hordei]KAJ1599726.1 hypothetical protein NDA14_001214 [Ustilago hordei]